MQSHSLVCNFSSPLLIPCCSIEEIRVCTNRTCRRQGSLQTLQTLSALAPPHVSVNSCGCLGRCGSGPNLAVLPDSIVIGHCATAARAAELLLSLSGGGSTDLTEARTSLDALALRKRAKTAMEGANFSEADLLLSQAIALKPFGGLHILHRDRSIARLAVGNYIGALEDAKEALILAPRYSEAYICQGDALLGMDQFDAAETSYSTALEIDPSIRRSKSFKARVAKLQQKLTATSMS